MLETAYKAGEFIRTRAFNFGSVELKKKDDPVTLTDKEAEKLIKLSILREFENSGFIGEEGGEAVGDPVWIIDPIDGTKSFVKRKFDSSVSIAIQENGMITHGCVYDFMRDIMYSGSVGSGNKMYHLGKEVEFRKQSLFEKRDISYDTNAAPLLKKLLKLDDKLKFYKGQGSMALDLAHCAFGVYNGVLNHLPDKGNIWDVAAGYFLVQNSGSFEVLNSKGEIIPEGIYDTREGFLALRKDQSHYLTQILK